MERSRCIAATARPAMISPLAALHSTQPEPRQQDIRREVVAQTADQPRDIGQREGLNREVLP